MKTTWFTIDTENNITAFATEEEANAHPGMRYAFADRSSLLTILTESPDLGKEILSGVTGAELPENGLKPAAAARLIWEGIQPLAKVVHAPEKPVKTARVRAQGAVAASKAPKASKKATPKKKAPKTAKKAKPAKSAKPAKKERARATGDATQTGPREGTKAAKLVELLKRPDGATLKEIVKKFDWLPHTTRALLSAGGSLRKMGIVVESFKPEDGERTYRIAS
jgi:hypothetical protein